jgi:hypothetical protein
MTVIAGVVAVLVGHELTSVAGIETSWDDYDSFKEWLSYTLRWYASVFIEAIASGFCVGLAQYLLLRNELNEAAAWWIPATLFGSVAGVAAGSVIGWGFIPAYVLTYVVLGDARPLLFLSLVAASGVEGIVLGLSQRLVLEKSLGNTRLWVVVNIIGAMAAGAVVSGTALFGAPFVAIGVAALAGSLLTACLTAWAFRRLPLSLPYAGPRTVLSTTNTPTGLSSR